MPLTPDEKIDLVLDDIFEGRSPSKRLTKAEAQAAIGNFYIKSGDGTFYPENMKKQNLCIMQTVNIYHHLITQTEFHGDWMVPYTGVDEVDPVIEDFMIRVNDNVIDDDRQKLLAYVPKLLNTKVDEKTTRRMKILRKLYAETTNDNREDFDHFIDHLSIEQWDKYDRDIECIPNAAWKKLALNSFDMERMDTVITIIYRESGFEGLTKIINRLLRAR